MTNQQTSTAVINTRPQRLADTSAPPRYLIGRPLRAIAGCDESILAECPEERFKFSGFGLIILFTASLAALSMTLALRILFPETSLRFLAPIGGLWGLFVLAMDRWLVSTHGQGRFQVILRLSIAVFFGFIVAEPLVLRVFEDAVEERFATDRQDEVASLGGRLDYCNPEMTEQAPAPSAPDDCQEDEILNLALPALASLPSVNEREAERSVLREEIGELNDDINRRLELLDGEIAGDVGSGQAGDGPAARSIREGIEAQQEQRDVAQERLNRLEQLVADEVETRSDAIDDRATAVNDYNRRRSEAADARTEELERAVGETPGFALRMDTLTDLSWGSKTIFVSRILLTLFFVLIDASPAIVRLSTSGGAYDAIAQSRQAERIASAEAVDQLAAPAPFTEDGGFRVYDIFDPYRADRRNRHSGVGAS